jgi:hypothetical protein
MMKKAMYHRQLMVIRSFFIMKFNVFINVVMVWVLV